MPAHLYIFEKLLNASSQDQIFSFLNQQCDQLGYSCYFYTPLVVETGSFKEAPNIVEAKDLVNHMTFTTYPSSWINRYQEAEHVKIDPVVRQVATSNLPVFWDDLTRRRRKGVVFDEARQHGLANGITVPVCGPNGGRALFSIATDTPPEKSSKHSAATAGLVLLTALHLHEAAQRIVKSTTKPFTPHLTSREKDCLKWAALGKTSWEIANILSVSERTVIFHIVNATKKLNAANRRQAVVRAISLGLITP